MGQGKDNYILVMLQIPESLWSILFQRSKLMGLYDKKNFYVP